MKERGVPPPTSHPSSSLELTNFKPGKREQNFNETSFQQTAGAIEKVRGEVLTAGWWPSWPLFSRAIGG